MSLRQRVTMGGVIVATLRLFLGLIGAVWCVLGIAGSVLLVPPIEKIGMGAFGFLGAFIAFGAFRRFPWEQRSTEL